MVFKSLRIAIQRLFSTVLWKMWNIHKCLKEKEGEREIKAVEMIQNSMTNKAKALNLLFDVKTVSDGNSVWEYC